MGICESMKEKDSSYSKPHRSMKVKPTIQKTTAKNED
jgi:hypothetical protein